MIHPLLEHIKDYSEEELSQHIGKLTQALYSTKNEYLIHQITLAIDDMREMLQQKITSGQAKGEKELDKLVNIS